MTYSMNINGLTKDSDVVFGYTYTYGGENYTICLNEEECGYPFGSSRYEGYEVHSFVYSSEDGTIAFKSKEEAFENFAREVSNRFGEQGNVLPIYSNGEYITLESQGFEFVGFVVVNYDDKIGNAEDFVDELSDYHHTPLVTADIFNQEGEQFDFDMMPMPKRDALEEITACIRFGF